MNDNKPQANQEQFPGIPKEMQERMERKSKELMEQRKKMTQPPDGYPTKADLPQLKKTHQEVFDKSDNSHVMDIDIADFDEKLVIMEL